MYKHFYVSAVPEMYGGNIPSDAVDLLDTHTFGTIEISGLYRPAADDYITALGGIAASYYGGMSVKYREIKLNLDAQNDMQRMRLYHVLPYGKPRRFWIETNAGVFWIDGYVTGMPEGSSNNEIIANLDVTIKCPYPWFRSLHAHSVVVTPFTLVSNGDGSYIPPTSADYTSVRQKGDIPAGVQVWAEWKNGHPAGGSYPGSAFTLQDFEGNAFQFQYIFDDNAKIDYSGGAVMLVDTTEGVQQWANFSKISNGTYIENYIPACIAFTGESVVVQPFKETMLVFWFNYYMDYTETHKVTLKWFDTWSGI